MIRLFLDTVLQPKKIIHLTGDKAHYVITVLRCRADDIIVVTDSSGNAYTARISALIKKQATLEVVAPLQQDNESPLELILLQGLLKGEKMDLVVQKATELGVTEIMPTITQRSQIRETRKLQRWQKIAEEASRQCGRNRVPLVHEPATFDAVMSSRQFPNGIICWEEEGAPFSSALDALSNVKRIILCIGPEGGFSEKEVKAATDCGFTAATLGKRILRAETAALTAIALTQFVLGDL